MKNENKQLEERIQELQKESLENARANTKSVLDDEIVRKRFRDLQNHIHTWTRKYSCSGPLADVHMVDWEVIKITFPLDEKNCLETDFQKIRQLKVGRTVILNTLLSRLIYDYILSEPFHSIQSTVQELGNIPGNNDLVAFAELLNRFASLISNRKTLQFLS